MDAIDATPRKVRRDRMVEYTFFAPPWFRAALQLRAKAGERTVSQEIRRALRAWLESEDPEARP